MSLAYEGLCREWVLEKALARQELPGEVLVEEGLVEQTSFGKQPLGQEAVEQDSAAQWSLVEESFAEDPFDADCEFLSQRRNRSSRSDLANRSEIRYCEIGTGSCRKKMRGYHMKKRSPQ